MNSKSLKDLLVNTRTMSIATCGEAGPWSAPVYFLFTRGCFHFFSSATSRHIEDALSAGHCAVSLFCEEGDWESIRGLQMSGRIESAPVAPAMANILVRYVGKFPTVKHLFPTSLEDLKNFTDKSGTRLYAFTAEEVLLVDNSRGFGSRESISLPDVQD